MKRAKPIPWSRHQAIGPQLHIRLAQPLAQEVEIKRVVLIVVEQSLPPVAALGHMMRHIRNHETGASGHGKGRRGSTEYP